MNIDERTKAKEQLRNMQRGTSYEVAVDFYDRLRAVGLDDMSGSWDGEGLPTGHPYDGVLERLGWRGKRFDGPEEAHPLVFDGACVNPALVPLALLRNPRLLRAPIVARLFPVVRPLLSTRKPKARLRMTEYRGVVTATMCYDDLPIHDAFRKLDDDTLVGAMDMRGFDRPFLFVLRRAEPTV